MRWMTQRFEYSRLTIFVRSFLLQEWGRQKLVLEIFSTKSVIKPPREGTNCANGWRQVGLSGEILSEAGPHLGAWLELARNYYSC